MRVSKRPSRDYVPPQRAFALVEVMIAVALMAVLSGPFLYGMVVTKKQVHSSSRDVQAVQVGTRVLERLAAVPFDRLPEAVGGFEPDAGAADLIELGLWGVDRVQWDLVFAGGGESQIDWETLVGSEAIPGISIYLWIERVEDKTALVPFVAKEVTVIVLYEASGPRTQRRRSFVLRTHVLPARENS